MSELVQALRDPMCGNGIASNYSRKRLVISQSLTVI